MNEKELENALKFLVEQAGKVAGLEFRVAELEAKIAKLVPRSPPAKRAFSLNGIRVGDLVFSADRNDGSYGYIKEIIGEEYHCREFPTDITRNGTANFVLTDRKRMVRVQTDKNNLANLLFLIEGPARLNQKDGDIRYTLADYDISHTQFWDDNGLPIADCVSIEIDGKTYVGESLVHPEDRKEKGSLIFFKPYVNRSNYDLAKGLFRALSRLLYHPLVLKSDFSYSDIKKGNFKRRTMKSSLLSDLVQDFEKSQDWWKLTNKDGVDF